ncbi:hypothetical protein B566_EDAN010610 [Ephemera danica]|nr:hypothetical protein B566_EDAN010610 [Ephemera danica]
MILTNKREVLHSYFQAYELDADGNEKQVAVDHESFYRGRVFGELQSEASVHIGDEGVMTATIHLPDEDFRLILTQKREVLHSNFQAYELDADGNEKPVAVDHESFYRGRVFGELQSEASVHIEDEGVMTATIHLPDESYHIEPAWRHLPESDPRKMVTYRASDVKLSWEHEDDEQDDSPFSPNHKHHGARTCGYIREGPQEDDGESEEEHDREKRQADNYEYTPTKTRCPLLLVADYRFYQEMGGGSTKNTINYLISLIDRVHKIYNDTIWHDRAELDGFKGMGFVIKKIVVHSEPTRVRGGEAHYNMVRDKWDVRNLLEVFSRFSFGSNKEHCLRHLFTHQTFHSPRGSSTVLGLAYIASSRWHGHGGICSHEYFKNGYTLYLNSGLSSSRNHYGQRVITREADLVTAHEFGHNWGSEHDPDIPECSPGASQGGSYLMYTYSVSGYDVNNKGLCEKTIQDVVERFWDIIEDININKVLLFLKDNLVGTVLIVTALLWLPASCLVSYVDRRRRLEDAARWEWRTRDELLHPRDPPRRVIYARNIPTVSTSAPTPQSNQASQAAQATPLRRMHLSSLSAPLH